MSQEPIPPERVRGVRWWPAVLILMMSALARLALLFAPSPSQQDRTIHVAQIVLLAGLLLLLWILFWSRIPWGRRFAVAAVALLCGAMMAGLFRYRGVNGDLVPLFEPRWTHHENRPPTSVGSAMAAQAPPGVADFPQFMGPNRNGRLAGPKLATNWTAQPPTLLWRRPVGAAWSGFAVAGGVAITQEQRGSDECVIAYDLQTGQVLWSHTDATRFFDPLAGVGPRATPTIVGRRVLTHGGTGLLNCLDLGDGHRLWMRDPCQEKSLPLPTWGESTSPLVARDLVFVNIGGGSNAALAAYRLSDGAPAWAAQIRNSGYSSPELATLAGARQVLLFGGALMASDADTGRLLWKFSWPGANPRVALPVVAGADDVIIANGYGTGSARIKIERDATGAFSAKQIWRSNRMKAKFTDLILDGSFIYGLDDGIMECIDAETGAMRWKEGRYGHGQTLLVGGLLLVMAEDGEVILLEPRPDQPRELTRFTALSDKTWNPPALAGEYLLTRNDKEAACFRLPVQK